MDEVGGFEDGKLAVVRAMGAGAVRVVAAACFEDKRVGEVTWVNGVLIDRSGGCHGRISCPVPPARGQRARRGVGVTSCQDGVERGTHKPCPRRNVVFVTDGAS